MQRGSRLMQRDHAAGSGRLRRISRPLPSLLISAGPLSPTRPAPLLWRGFLRYPADRIHKGVIELLMVEGRSELPAERRVETGRRDRLTGRIGFRMEPERPESDPLRVKLQWLLWARHFADTGGDPGAEAETDINRLCDELGFQRLANGAHRPANRRSVGEALLQLEKLELDLDYAAPDGSRTRLAGPVWRLSVREGKVRLQPGVWSQDPVWRRFNAAVGLAPAGLLRLRGDRDAWAIRIGSYLTTLARINGYRPLELRVEGLLKKSGLEAAEARNPARMREKLERALERLEETGCLAGWDWSATGEEPDMDVPASLADLHRAAKDWRDDRVRITWPLGLQGRMVTLEERRQAAVGRQRRARPTRV